MSTERLAFRCKGCGELDSIVEVSLMPFIAFVVPDEGKGATPFEDVDYGETITFSEADVDLGFGCYNESCERWQGNYGQASRESQVNANGRFVEIDLASNLSDIAELVKVTESYTEETVVEVVA